jgi:hypothetical protein
MARQGANEVRVVRKVRDRGIEVVVGEQESRREGKQGSRGAGEQERGGSLARSTTIGMT